MKKYAVIVAGGSGQRMGVATPKQFLLLNGKPLLWYSVRAFLSSFDDISIILVLPSNNRAEGESIVAGLDAAARVTITEGGATRFHSVQNGLALVKEPSVVFVHDGVRCLVTSALINRCYNQALEKGSAIPAVAATDSIRIVDGDNHTVANRSYVRIIQTPQTFRSEIILPAYDTPYNDSFTDEATVAEAAGHKVFLVDGEHENIKITRPVDLLVAERILKDRL
ncbi:2-C-methyl-D-erythritol 4-phosphate cytidylyltransferase [Sediminibacterium roseum]|uniref:2-C-methyl-D-erythritol 4-phosphate cytidylyltransferase n=1 Tax=Sediminibacterium roseum TaxID=1978412 RepID=A0ABW9ZX14_9BACT|nr:2-C-methyl-D-erythritol 4-phosphate cytidylyltransferase [Sediminibacterium roseum]NCI50872.1 2-C-methyl-D-erythritol 4-phosphate cytidylyltransferase [Sediminibacterium roseum]